MKTAVNGNLLLELRTQNGYSISDMAGYLGYKTPTGYWLLEKGKRRVSVDVLYRLSQLYGREMEEFLLLQE